MPMDNETHRHRCEVRMLIRAVKERGRQWVKEYLDDKRVAGRKEKLREDLNAQIKAGNTGEHGTWL